ncbi:MAG: T9SS type A sorting domain-containing protein [Bacteroidota bacterium]
MKRTLLTPVVLLAAFFFSNKTLSQTVQIVNNQSQSGNIVIGLFNYHVSENIYTETEIGASNFTSVPTAINHIDFNAFAVGSNTSINNYNIYFKEVPLSETSFTTGAYDTTGFTLVFSGTFTAASTGWVGVDLTTAFVRTAGNNLRILIERLDNTPHAGYSFNASVGNDVSTSTNSSRRFNNNTLPVSGTTSLTASTFRAQVQLRHINPNDAAITTVYTLGKLPIPFATPHTISTNIVNNGSNTLTNLDVTLDITGANIFSNTKTIATLAPGASTLVSFDAFTPLVAGFNNVSVSVPADDFNADNSRVISQEVTANAYSYAYGDIASGATGFSITGLNPTGTGDIVAKFTTASPTTVNQAGVRFAAGGQPFKIGIWDKSGNGVPGNLLWESTEQVSTVGEFTLPINPPVAVIDTFYIGVKQLGSTNVQFAYQNESPIRPNTFFLTYPTGSNTWADFAPSPANPFKFMIEPRLTIANDVGVASIINPVGASTIDNCGILPEAVISNFGSNDQTTPFDVTFSIKQSGSVVYSDTKQVALNSGESQSVYFNPFLGSVTGADSSFVITSLSIDGARNNDTVVNVFNTEVYSYSDSSIASDGYSYANSTPCASLAPIQPSYNWITQTDAQINWGANGDDSVLATPIALPFPFKFFGNTYNQLWICSNGWISFSDPTALSAATTRTPVNMPLAGGVDNYIAGAFTDLDNTSATYSDAQTFYGNDASGFVITFNHAHLFGSADDYITFQVILKVNGDILIQYNDAESTSPAVSSITNFCSVGIENAGGTKGIRYRLNGNGGSVFGSPLALQFYARPTPPVPVSLLHFSAEKGKLANKLQWVTIQEINSKEFIIERSGNGTDFISIGNVAANGNSNRNINYSFIDGAIQTGINYYRLAILNADNSKKYSSIITVKNDEATGFAVYPNPARDKIIVWFNAEKICPAVIRIFDIDGKLVYSKNLQVNNGSNNVPLNIEKFIKGNYVLKTEINGTVIVSKFSKL